MLLNVSHIMWLKWFWIHATLLLSNPSQLRRETSRKISFYFTLSNWYNVKEIWWNKTNRRLSTNWLTSQLNHWMEWKKFTNLIHRTGHKWLLRQLLHLWTEIIERWIYCDIFITISVLLFPLLSPPFLTVSRVLLWMIKRPFPWNTIGWCIKCNCVASI